MSPGVKAYHFTRESAGEYPNVAGGGGVSFYERKRLVNIRMSPGGKYHFTRERACEYPNVAWGEVSIGEKALVKVLFYEICGTLGFLFWK